MRSPQSGARSRSARAPLPCPAPPALPLAVYVVQGFTDLAGTAIPYALKDTLHLDPAQSGYLYTVIQVPCGPRRPCPASWGRRWSCWRLLAAAGVRVDLARDAVASALAVRGTRS